MMENEYIMDRLYYELAASPLFSARMAVNANCIRSTSIGI
jgi:hypothetical protein